MEGKRRESEGRWKDSLRIERGTSDSRRSCLVSSRLVSSRLVGCLDGDVPDMQVAAAQTGSRCPKGYARLHTQCAASNSISRGTAFRNSANNVRLIIRKLSALTVETRLVGARERRENGSTVHAAKVEFPTTWINKRRNDEASKVFASGRTPLDFRILPRQRSYRRLNYERHARSTGEQR